MQLTASKAAIYLGVSAVASVCCVACTAGSRQLILSLVRCMSTRAAVVVFAVFTLASITCVLAAEYRWRLSRAEAIRLAERAAVAQGFKLRDYPDRSVKQLPRSREWFVSFEPPSPAPPDQGFLVVVDDGTGKAELFRGA